MIVAIEEAFLGGDMRKLGNGTRGTPSYTVVVECLVSVEMDVASLVVEVYWGDGVGAGAFSCPANDGIDVGGTRLKAPAMVSVIVVVTLGEPTVTVELPVFDDGVGLDAIEMVVSGVEVTETVTWAEMLVVAVVVSTLVVVLGSAEPAEDVPSMGTTE